MHSTPLPPDPREASLRGRRTSRRGKLAVALAGLAIGLLLAEVAVRILVGWQDARRVAEWNDFRLQSPDRETRPSTDSLGDIIRPSPIADIVYALIPGLDVIYNGGRLTTNRDGFRGPLLAKAKSPGTLRIVSLGDSVMFGSGVADDEVFVRVAERIVNAEPVQQRIEILNTAVPGYNTAMEVATLEHVALAWQPDVVWIDFVGNDFSLPNFVANRRDPWALDRSFLADRIAALFDDRSDSFEPLKAAKASRSVRGFEFDPDLVPAEYRHMVGYDGYRRAMKRLAHLASEHGFVVIVTHHAPSHDVVNATCREFGFTVVSGRDPVEAWMKENGISEYLGSSLTVSASDPHPSALQHRILGEHYARLLLQSGAFR